MRILLVGGAVRNILLGLPVKDRDYLVFEATVEDFLRRFPTAKMVGKTFPICILDGQEFSFLRGKDLAGDLTLRDFTLNALALDWDGTLICHETGLEDLQARVLRSASPRALLDDPLRIFRAVRLSLQLPGFHLHLELCAQMAEAAQQPGFSQLLAERVGQEVLKAMQSESPGNFLRMLHQTHCLNVWFEELKDAAAIPAGPPQFHDASVLEHTACLMDALCGDALCVWMGLCHDLGKTTTPQDMLPRHIGHETRGEQLALALGHRLRLPMRFIKAGADAARWHMLAGNYGTLRPATRVDLLYRLKSRALLRELFHLVHADQRIDHLPEVMADLEAAESVRLPAELCGLGELSGQHLRRLRGEAIRLRQKTNPLTKLIGTRESPSV
jgi:tRNA nucleotidyltransferase (CCA-adding enzyme)